MLQSRSGRATHGICSKKEWYAVGLITVPLIHVPLVALTCKCCGQTCSLSAAARACFLPERRRGRRRALFDRSMQAVCARRHRLHFNRLKFGATNLTRLEHSSGFAHLLLPRGKEPYFLSHFYREAAQRTEVRTLALFSSASSGPNKFQRWYEVRPRRPP